jgi:ribosomal-protein-alanine N-acetyltransferase
MVAQFDGFKINPIHDGDAWKICDFAVSNANRLKRYFPKTLEQNLNPTLSQIYVEKNVKAFHENELFVFTLKQINTRQLAGLVILKEVDWTIKQGEFAYAMDYNFTGQGLMSKTIDKLSKYAFEILGLERLQIIVNKDNVSSMNVALNNQFKWQKTLENEFKPVGEQPLNMELYELYK